MSNENNAGVDLAQLDKLELRAKEEKGEGYKLMAVKHDVILALIDLARRASATPSSKDAGGEPMYQISIDCTNVLWKDVDKEDYDEHPSDWKREKRIVYAAPAHAAAAPSWEQGRDAQRYRKLAARFKYDHIGQGRNGYHYDADPIPGDGLEFDAAVDALPAVEPDTTDMASAAGAGSAPHAQAAPVYQVRVIEQSWAWTDASEEAYHTFSEKRRRILYAAPVPQEAEQADRKQN